MTVTHARSASSPFELATDQIGFPAHEEESGNITLAHYPSISTLAIGLGDDEIGTVNLEEFKKFARKVLADELAEPPAPEWHDAKVVRGRDEGNSRIFLRNGAKDDAWITDHGIQWPTNVLASLIEDIEIVVAGDE